MICMILSNFRCQHVVIEPRRILMKKGSITSATVLPCKHCSDEKRERRMKNSIQRRCYYCNQLEVYKKTGFRTETGKKTETGFFLTGFFYNRFFFNRFFLTPGFYTGYYS
ncbi:hypothetical protein HanIR_Chr16g0844771 [Helianthus annuus]|nr:hypothetical protein HanIR_Chr16g0844771 [Helianthus annuus]